LWTLEELCLHVEAVLASQGVASENGRIRALPDERTLRYYTTLGLLARPAVLKGRTAFYDRTHLAQVVAIKRLQARGNSLARIQERLAGCTARELDTLARLPDPLPETTAVAYSEAPAPTRAFWAETSREQDEARAEPRSGTWVELAASIFLMLPGAAPRTREDHAALLQAAAPLLAELGRQGLLTPQPR
jgi:DNA-binding transcriptional MerR regulator